jgi:hypothetical protein
MHLVLEELVPRLSDWTFQGDDMYLLFDSLSFGPSLSD